MQTKTQPKYHDLATESSNLMIEAKGKWVLENYPVATNCFLKAGRLRSQMGQISFNDSQLAHAATDWLSATACFLQATSLEQARVRLNLVRGLKKEAKIPEDRLDIHRALEEREEEFTNLEKKIEGSNHRI